MGKLVESRLPCPDLSGCGSSDAFSRYLKSDGTTDGFCYSCNRWFDDPYKDQKQAEVGSLGDSSIASKSANYQKPYLDSRVETVEECLLHPIRAIKDRGISYQTCEHYGVRVGVDTRDGETPIYHLYPCYVDEELVGYKQRIVNNKQFLGIGDCKNLDLFGANVCKKQGKKLFITEGEIDCLSLYQVLKEQSTIDWEPCVVSLPQGSGSAVKSITKSLDFINNFEQVILCFDNDAPGKEATKNVCKMLAGKVYTTTFSEKDPNEMLLKNKATELKWAVLSNIKKYQPDGIINGSECWERYKETLENTYYPFPSNMPGLNEKLYGLWPGSIFTVTAGTGIGKTQFLRELKYHFLETTDLKIADISLEEDISETIGGMLSIELNKRITLPDVKMSEEEERKAFDHIYGSGRFLFYDFFGGMDDENLFQRLRYFICSGCKLIFLDHLSIIISEYATDGDERKRIDAVMTKMARLVKETGAIIVLVVHLSNPDKNGKSFEEGKIPTINHLRGSGAIKQCTSSAVGLSRNQQHPDKRCANTVELTVLKARKAGRTGSAGFLYFDDSSGRYIQTEMPEGYRK